MSCHLDRGKTRGVATGRRPASRAALRYYPDAAHCATGARPRGAGTLGEGMDLEVTAGRIGGFVPNTTMSTSGTYVLPRRFGQTPPKGAASAPASSRHGLRAAAGGRPSVVARGGGRPAGSVTVSGASTKGCRILEWVSRAAIAHEAVVEAFVSHQTLVPMKLLTIFNSDARAVEQVPADQATPRQAVETGGRSPGVGSSRHLPGPDGVQTAGDGRPSSNQDERRWSRAGARYLSLKKAQREAEAGRARHGSQTLKDVYDRLSAQSTLARRRSSSELPLRNGPLLLDAAFLVPRSRMRAFRSSAMREGTRLGRLGYQLLLTGPWPPYTFVKD